MSDYATQTSSGEDKFGIGWVLKETFAVIGRRSSVLLPISILFIALPELLVSWVTLETGADFMASMRLSNLFTVTVGLIAHMATIHVALRDQEGLSVGIDAAIVKGARLWPAAILLSIVINVATLLGLVLLIVPGVFLAIVWSAALPWRADRGPTIGQAMSGSFALTKGSRWRILGLGLMLLLMLAGLIVAFLIPTVLVMVLAPQSGDFFVDVVLGPLLITAMTLIASVASALLYRELVRVQAARSKAADRETTASFDA